MAWRRVSAEQVTAAVEALIAGRSLKAAAAEAGVTCSTAARWFVTGAPVTNRPLRAVSAMLGSDVDPASAPADVWPGL